MKTRKKLWAAGAALIIAALLLAAGAAYAHTAGYAPLSWGTVDGGGGRSTASGYALSGTIGQPDAYTLTGGSYRLQGGFWGGGTAQVIAQARLYLPLVKRP